MPVTATATTHSSAVAPPPPPPPPGPSSHQPNAITTSSSNQQPPAVANDHAPNSALASVFGAMQQHIPTVGSQAQHSQPLPTFSPARTILQHIQQQPTAFRSGE
uniref:Uncharacterized protein n=1 Tax=Anopheles culicifacies TaxID=139723 RepID=A0A182LZP4_9DIPT